jgi:hypothetical protein
MHIRPVLTDELDLYVGAVPNYQREVEQYLESMFAAGSMRPEWCFAAVLELAGLVMTAEPSGFLTIFNVGVVPGMRGQGYIDDLLAASAATLLEARRRDATTNP